MKKDISLIYCKSTYPDASVGVCCSHKVVAVGFNTLMLRRKRRGIKPSARIKAVQTVRYAVRPCADKFTFFRSSLYFFAVFV